MLSIVLFIGGAEIFIIILVILILFGAKRLPDIAKGLGKGLTEFKKATADIKKELTDDNNELVNDFKDVKKTVTKTVADVKKTIDSSDIGKEVRSIRKNIPRIPKK